jgi:two-component system, cell cycle response regulator DivK
MGQGSRMPSQKILVVDDDPILRMMFDDALTFAGYTVVTAASGVQALVLAETEEPDLIVMDCQMPGMTGLEVARRLSQNPATRKIPVLGVAGAMAAELAELIAAGYTACIPKPISLDRLYEAVAGLLPAINREEQASG